jgi:acetylornithine deacetylase/succinyl-diaminopimelate desuccinylase-like protein
VSTRRAAPLAAALTVGSLAAGSLAASIAAAPETATPGESAEDQAAGRLAHELFRQLIEINTTDSVGNVTTASEALAERFRAAGFAPGDVFVGGPNERKKNLVVRLHGSGAHRPVLIIGHLDVVEAQRADWSTDPFKLVQKDGYFYGRGTLDMKDGDAVMVSALLRMKREGFRPQRDIIMALTADEEGGCCNGVHWLIEHHRELIDAEFVLNQDDWSVECEHGVPHVARLIAAEKLYGDYQLTATNKGGHSSVPQPDNAIYELAGALTRVSQLHFPFELNNVTRGYFQQLANGMVATDVAADMRAMLRSPPDPQAIDRLSADPEYAAMLHTTCVATRLSGGHANNALPQRAEAVVNCRILPGHSKEEVRQDLIRALADPHIVVRYVADDGRISDTAPQQRALAPAPLRPEVLQPLQTLVASTWPSAKLVPSMSAGASDAIFTDAAGLPTYTFGGVTFERDDARAHGRDERLSVAAFYTWNRLFYRYLKAVTSTGKP